MKLKFLPMGPFDIFRKIIHRITALFFVGHTSIKPPVPPSNDIELLLEKAARDPTIRHEFYTQLLTHKLIVITKNDSNGTRTYTAQKGDIINVIKYPDGKIPVFTSKTKIFDKGVIKEQVHISEIMGKDLFILTKGATLLLNPYSDYGKEFFPHEIDQILDIASDAGVEKIVVKKETEIQIGQPAVYPQQMVDTLSQIFATKPSVKSAYIAWIFNPSANEPPHYLIAIEGEGDLQPIKNEAGNRAYQFLDGKGFLDMIELTSKSGLYSYFVNDSKPFYVR